VAPWQRRGRGRLERRARRGRGDLAAGQGPRRLGRAPRGLPRGSAAAASARLGDRLALVDFERVGWGTPGDDLAAWAIQALPPAERRDAEEGLVAAYFEKLAASAGASLGAFDAAACWADYVGGVGGLLFRLPGLAAAGDARADDVAGRVAAFLADRVSAAGRVPAARP